MEQKEYVGLTKEEVAQRTAQGLSNKADLKAGRTEGQIVAAHLFTFFNCIFVVLAVILALVQSSVKNMTFLGVVVPTVLSMFSIVVFLRIGELALVYSRVGLE